MFPAISLFRQWVLLASAASLLLSCNKADPAPSGGSLRVQFDNVAGDSDLLLNETRCYNAGGEDFFVTKFNYFVSNFKLYKTDGSVYTIPQDSCYFLIREDDSASQFVMLRNIPVGDYDQVEFMVGVDSLRNTMDESRRTGALDPRGSMVDDGMHWSWNSGYIFVKLEGSSPFGNPANDKFYYHIGLYGGYNDPTPNNTRIVKVKFGEEAVTVTESKTPEVHLFADVLKFFDGPAVNLSIAEYNGIMASPNHWPLTRKIADNYQQMFSYNRIH